MGAWVMKRHPVGCFLGGWLLLGVSQAGGATETTPSLQGFSGLWNTPNAWVTPEGAADLAFNDQADARWRRKVVWDDEYLIAFGLFQGLEGGLRLSTYGKRAKPPSVDFRDLSNHIKYQLPFLPDWMPRLALGAQDVGGKATHYRSSYAVATEDLGPLRLSLGRGTGPDRMKGVFGGGELQVTSWLQIVADRDTVDNNLGLKLLTPRGTLPASLVAGGYLKSTLNGRAGHFDGGLFLRVPLGGRPPSCVAACAPCSARPSGPPLASPPGVESSSLLLPALPPPSPASPQPEVSSALAALTRRLEGLGLEILHVGTRGTTLVVAYENHRFNHNELDALGLVLGTALRAAPGGFDTFLVIAKKRSMSVLEVAGPVEAFRAWFQSPGDPAPGILKDLIQIRSDPGLGDPAGVQWAGPLVNPSLLHTSLILSPSLVTHVGTEFGVFDYRLGLAPETLTGLWPGAALNVAWTVPRYDSVNFRPRHVFATSDDRPGLSRAMLSQAVPLAPGLVTQVTGGIYDGLTNGFISETIWSPGSGTHQFWVEAGRFTGDGEPPREVRLGAYR